MLKVASHTKWLREQSISIFSLDLFRLVIELPNQSKISIELEVSMLPRYTVKFEGINGKSLFPSLQKLLEDKINATNDIIILIRVKEAIQFFLIQPLFIFLLLS